MPPKEPISAKATMDHLGMQRFLVNRDNGDVFVWTDRLAEAYPAMLEEVFAKDAATAKVKRAIPDPRTVSLAQLEAMGKADLILFARVKMEPPVEVDESMTKDDMLDVVKEALFTRVVEQPPKG
jgi:hypothetical protein